MNREFLHQEDFIKLREDHREAAAFLEKQSLLHEYEYLKRLTDKCLGLNQYQCRRLAELENLKDCFT